MNCTYCGVIRASTLDHVVPISSFHSTRTRSSYARDKVIPSCSECNSLLGDVPFYTIGSRAGYLVTCYRERYKTQLAAKPWTEQELDQLEGDLKRAVGDPNQFRQKIQDRITHCEFVSEVGPTLPEVWEAADPDKLSLLELIRMFG